MYKILSYILLFFIVFFFAFFRIDYYIIKPGGAYDVSEFVKVKNGDIDDEGTFNLMTVSMSQATPLTYLIASMKEFEDIKDVDEIHYDEEDEEEYDIRQLQLMSDSQFNALYVAFSHTKLPYTVTYDGVVVLNILNDGAADGVLKPGDIIVEMDGTIIKTSEDLTTLLENRKENEKVDIVVKRDNQLLDLTLQLKPIPKSDEQKIGLGITFSENKKIKTEPRVTVNTEEIGGPSAGLMFTLEILNQLLDEDLTKGYDIAGTGEMHMDGTVGRIGGVEKKVVAADKQHKEIFFVPDDDISEEMKKQYPDILSNYEAAVKTAKEIGTDMKIVPVKSVDDALDYLEQLPSKK